jgi:outer membrane protein assembly factor BamB
MSREQAFSSPLRTMTTTIVIFAVVLSGAPRGQDANVPMPSGPMVFGMFEAQFATNGTFRIEGKDWDTLRGSWKINGAQLELLPMESPPDCAVSGRYNLHVEGTHVRFEAVSDSCAARRMVLDQSSWRPAGEAKTITARRIVRIAAARTDLLRPGGDSSGSWPSFRGSAASGVADGRSLPETWNIKTGENVLWRTRIPGLGHSSPVVWGDRIFVTTAISSDPNATFRPGLYGDGDSSSDRTRHRFVTYAIDKRSGKVLWERVAYEGHPMDRRHIKSTYASSTPATDGRVVISWFGSQGVYAYDVNGTLRWKVDLGRLDLGAYNIPTFEWGPASSPIIWNGLVILQCDTHEDSFIVALNEDTGEIVWKTERDELPSWGTPTVAMTSGGPELVTNASRFIRGYDPRDGRELWRLGRSSLITAPTPVFGNDLFVIASGRAPERPIFVVRAGSHGDITLRDDQTRSDAIAWSRTGRGSYMPTPLIYKGVLYVLANNGVFDAYRLSTGDELYRERMPEIGSGFSASPIAANDRIFVSSEDGEVFVLQAGPTFKHISTNSTGELLMATPALSDGVMYVRSSQSLFAIGRKP